jgi:drug/metabolite transporter (DMT)-like permease
MLRSINGYIYILGTIIFTVYGQIVLKFRITKFGTLPDGSFKKLQFLVSLFFDPVILSCFFAAFLASLSWMATMTKFDLSHAYPFMSLNFVIVLLLSGWLLCEPITFKKVIGIVLIIFGTYISSQN